MKTDNELISEFMGISLTPIGLRRNVMAKSYYDNELKYSTSWDWLIPVVEKIESIEHVIIDIFKEATKVKYYKNDIQEWTTTQWDAESKISHVYKACIEFIKHYNSNN